MSPIILFCAVVIFSCIVTNKFSSKLGMPALMFFMFMGVLFGCDGVFKISFDDYDLTAKLCSIGLLFIIFYGGFCTRKPEKKIVTAQAVLLSSFGTILTAGFTCLFCYYALRIPFVESFLIGAVISSTDAASVFSILRSKRLNLRYGTAPILEMESGSNDPFAYILTVLGLVLLQGGTVESLVPMLFKQISLAILFGILIAYCGIFMLKRTRLLTEGTDTIFMVALALASFALPDLLGGNGFLSVYITGIILGNSEIRNKISLIYFFDGITALCQVLIFFLIGFLSFPHKIPEILVPAILIMLFLTFVARPLAVTLIMKPFKATWNQIFFISSAGLRGAASIVFAIMVVAENHSFIYDLFHIVFVVALLSVALQGSGLPYFAKRCNMIDRFADVRKTFNDYQQASAIALNSIVLDASHPWVGASLKEINISGKALVLLVNRDGKKFIPNGNTILKVNDEVLIGSTYSQSTEQINFCETFIDKAHEWKDVELKNLGFAENCLVALIKRNNEYFVPNGNSKILLGDTVIFYEI